MLESIVRYAPLAVFALFAYIFVINLFQPDSWLRFLQCQLLRHDWSEPYRPESDGYSPEIKECNRCGHKIKAHPPAPLVP